jgi:hypothetical protein
MKGLTIIAVLVLGGGYVAYLEHRASTSAEDFCRKAVVGAPLAGVAEAAKSAGERLLRRVTDDEVQVGFIGLPPFSRHLCVVKAEKGTIKSAWVETMD